MSLLPTKPKQKPKLEDISFLLLIGPVKIGFTEASLQLPNALHIDLQAGAKNFSGNAFSIDVLKVAMKAKLTESITENGIEKTITRPMKNKWESLHQIIKELRKKKAEEDFMYDFLIIDPAASLEEIARFRALELYETSVYKRKGSNDPTKYVQFDIGFQKGIDMLQMAFEEIINDLRNLTPHLIMKCHPKDNVALKQDKEVTVEGLDLLKPIAGWLAKEVDSIGVLYRAEHNVNKVSFVKTDNNPLVGARASHISNKIIDFSTHDKNGNITTNWESIYLHLKQTNLKPIKSETNEPTTV